MASAKDIVVKPINAQAANKVIKQLHYSGKVVPNSQLHLGVFLNDKLEGVMQFGPPINKKGTINIGNRQKGRLKSSSIIDSSCDSNDICRAIDKLFSLDFQYHKILPLY